METQTLFTDRRYRKAGGIVLVFIAAVLLSYGLGQVFLPAEIFTHVTSPLGAIVTTFLTIHLWIQFQKKGLERPAKVWMSLAVCFVLWTIAEITWEALTLAYGDNIPYPSVADALWVLGYWFIGAGLVRQIRQLQTPLSDQRRVFLIGIAALIVGVTALTVLPPILQDFALSRFVESVLSLLYPLGDTIVLVLILALHFTFEKGRLGSGWRIIMFGIGVMTVSDLAFSYTSWQGTYYPNGQMDLTTFLIDTTYSISYGIMSLGLYAYWLIFSETIPTAPKTGTPGDEQIILPARRALTSHLALFTNARDELISFSAYFPQLLKVDDEYTLLRRKLDEILGDPDRSVKGCLASLDRNGSIRNQPLTIVDATGEKRDAWLSGILIYDSEHQKSGGNLVLSFHADSPHVSRDSTPEERLQIQRILTHAGIPDDRLIALLLSYSAKLIFGLAGLVQRYNGKGVRASMLAALQKIAIENHCSLDESRQAIVPQDMAPMKQIQGRLREILQAAMDQVTDLVNQDRVLDEIKQIESRMGEEELALAGYYEMRVRR